MKFQYYNQCEHCNSTLDPGERCNCTGAEAERQALTGGIAHEDGNQADKPLLAQGENRAS